MAEAAKHPYVAPALMVGGGLAVVGVVWLIARQNSETVEKTERAIETGGRLKVKLTGYWPFVGGLSEKERKMEGGHNDRKGRPLYTLEQHLSDPARYPYVAVAGDDSIWPYGQRIAFEEWPNAVFRVVDTGRNFRGAGKVYRVFGHEPLDVCVNSAKTKLPKTATARIVHGDNFAGGTTVATARLRDQVISGVAMREGRTNEDREALARAIESELSHRTREEAYAAAWVIRNRADDAGVTVHALLAPEGQYGHASMTGGYVSTRRPPGVRSRNLANEVLDAPREEDPTHGAVEFWAPQQQSDLHNLGDVYRTATRNGDVARMLKFAPYADFGTTDEVRERFEQDDLEVVGIVGAIELLGRRAT